MLTLPRIRVAANIRGNKTAWYYPHAVHLNGVLSLREICTAYLRSQLATRCQQIVCARTLLSFFNPSLLNVCCGNAQRDQLIPFFLAHVPSTAHGVIYCAVQCMLVNCANSVDSRFLCTHNQDATVRHRRKISAFRTIQRKPDVVHIQVYSRARSQLGLFFIGATSSTISRVVAMHQYAG